MTLLELSSTLQISSISQASTIGCHSVSNRSYGHFRSSHPGIIVGSSLTNASTTWLDEQELKTRTKFAELGVRILSRNFRLACLMNPSAMRCSSSLYKPIRAKNALTVGEWPKFATARCPLPVSFMVLFNGYYRAQLLNVWMYKQTCVLDIWLSCIIFWISQQ